MQPSAKLKYSLNQNYIKLMAAEVLFFKAASWRMQPMTDSTKLQYSYNPIVEPKTDTPFL